MFACDMNVGRCGNDGMVKWSKVLVASALFRYIDVMYLGCVSVCRRCTSSFPTKRKYDLFAGARTIWPRLEMSGNEFKMKTTNETEGHLTEHIDDGVRILGLGFQL